MLKKQPLLVLQPSGRPLFGVQWSPQRAALFAAAAGDGGVYFYDLCQPQALLSPALRLDASAAGAPARALAFNARLPEVFAAAAGDAVRVWRLPELLRTPGLSEASLLRRVADADDPVGELRRR